MHELPRNSRGLAGTRVAVSVRVKSQYFVAVLSLSLSGCTGCTREKAGPPVPESKPGSTSIKQPDITSTPQRVIEAELTNAPEVPHGIYREAPARVLVHLEVQE